VSDILWVLSAIEAGAPQVAAHLLPLAYGKLPQRAASKMAKAPPDMTLEATWPCRPKASALQRYGKEG
jgi:hypothetical protein